MENLINELYYGNICPVEQMGEATSGEKEILRRIHENEEKLRATLDEQEKAIPEAIKDDCLTVSSSIGERRFFVLIRSLRIAPYYTTLGRLWVKLLYGMWDTV